MSAIQGAFSQTPSMYINARQPLRLELFEQYKAKIKKQEEDAKDTTKQREALHKSIKFSSDNAFGYKDKIINNPNISNEPTVNPNITPYA